MMNVKTRQGIALVILCTWLGSAVAGFWWFELRNLRPFNPQSSVNGLVLFEASARSVFNSRSLSNSDLPDGVTVVHFWNPDCACNRFNESHVREIIERYSKTGIRFAVVVKPQTKYTRHELRQLAEQRLGISQLIDADDKWLDDLNIPASPAALVLNESGEIAYFGPYSDGAFCSSRGSRFIENTLDALLKGDVSSQLNMAAYGCYCDWKTPNA